MRPSSILAILCLTLLVPGSASAADPSFLGPAGHFLTPSADTLGWTGYNLILHHRDHHNYIGGAYSPSNRIEFGGLVVDPTRPGVTKTDVLLHAKYVAVPEERQVPALAVGVWDPLGAIDGSPYVVASKSLRLRWPNRPVRLTAGIGGGLYQRGFYGLTLPVSPSVRGVAEFDGTYVNVGVRADLPHGFTADLGSVGGALGLGAAYGARW